MGIWPGGGSGMVTVVNNRNRLQFRRVNNVSTVCGGSVGVLISKQYVVGHCDNNFSLLFPEGGHKSCRNFFLHPEGVYGVVAKSIIPFGFKKKFINSRTLPRIQILCLLHFAHSKLRTFICTWWIWNIASFHWHHPDLSSVHGFTNQHTCSELIFRENTIRLLLRRPLL